MNQPMPPIPIVLFGDERMFVGMALVLSSLVAGLSPDRQVVVHLFYQKLSTGQIAELQGLGSKAGGRFSLRAQEIDVSLFQRFPSFNGDYLTYGRLLLPELLPEEKKVLYLDCDLLVALDVATLFDQDLAGKPIGGMLFGQVGYMDDRALFAAHHFHPDAPYINAGVLLLDLEIWRQQGMLPRSLEFMEANKALLIRHDQSLLNCLFHDQIQMLPAHFNVVVFPDLPPAKSFQGSIIHFAGTPKPWEIGARALNNQYNLYAAACAQLGLTRKRPLSWQFLKDPRSYLRLLLRKLNLHAVWKSVERSLRGN